MKLPELELPELAGAIVALRLFEIHHHEDTEKGRVFYYEDELLPVLQSFGVPAPDWAKIAEATTKEHRHKHKL